jgi:hypothetical protein
MAVMGSSMKLYFGKLKFSRTIWQKIGNSDSTEENHDTYFSKAQLLYLKTIKLFYLATEI